MAGNYDRQVVVQLGFDSIISGNALALNKYGNDSGVPSEIVEVHGSANGGVGMAAFRYADVRKLTTAFGRLTANSRVYLQGHGDWQSQKLEQYDAAHIAMLLSTAKMPNVKILSVLGCESARDLGTSNDCRVGNSTNSFASKLQLDLKNRNIIVDTYARVFCLGFYSSAWSTETAKHGRKGTFNDDDQFDAAFAKRVHSKILFSWANGTQTRTWAY